jgi:hypothetical protein
LVGGKTCYTEASIPATSKLKAGFRLLPNLTGQGGMTAGV